MNRGSRESYFDGVGQMTSKISDDGGYICSAMMFEYMSNELIDIIRRRLAGHCKDYI